MIMLRYVEIPADVSKLSWGISVRGKSSVFCAKIVRCGDINTYYVRSEFAGTH